MLQGGHAIVFEAMSSSVKKFGPKLAKKYEEYNFGDRLSNVLYTQYVLRKVDSSDFIKKFRDSIIAAGFFDYARGVNTNETDEISFANTYITNRVGQILNSAEILSDDAICYAAVQKRARFEKLLAEISLYNITGSSNSKNILVLKTNPSCSNEFRALELQKSVINEKMKADEFEDFHNVFKLNNPKIQELLAQIKVLKENYSSEGKQKIKELYKEIKALRLKIFESKSEKFLELEKQLTDIKAQENKLLKNELKDPQKKIELFYLYKELREQNLNIATSLTDFLAKNATAEMSQVLKSHIKNAVQNYLKLDDNQMDFLYNLGFERSPYIYKFFEIDSDSMKNLKLLISTLASSGMPVKSTLNNLEQNQATRELFEERGYDYDAWVSYDEKLDSIRLDKNTVIKKVDMDDIAHSLFLGNQVGCCTALGAGSRSEFAPIYVMNKFVQAVELIAEGKSVGNTMCYIATLSSGCDVLILDNIEVYPPYCDDSKYINAFFKLARNLTEKIGAPDMPICAGQRQKFKIKDFVDDIGPVCISLLGSSGDQIMNLDSINVMNNLKEPVSLETKYYVNTLYKFKEECFDED